MKHLTLLELSAQNWRAQNFADTYGEHENRISGRNKTGKSTRLAAFCWLLSSYTDANSPANSRLFDDRYELTKDTPQASVKAKVRIDDTEYTIERVAIAAFTRKRGTDDYVKSASDTYKYFIDEIERTATDFRDWVSENIAPDDMLRFVLAGDFFIGQIFDDKKKARQIIERVVGEVLPEEMKGDYSLIADELAKYTLDEIEARAANLSKGINQRLNEIPTLIQNMEREISEIEQTDFVANDREIDALEKERESLDQRLLDLTERVKPQMEAKYKAESERRMCEEIYKKELSTWLHEGDTERERLMGEINAIRKQNEDSQRKHDEAVVKRDVYTKKRDQNLEALKNAELKRERLLAERDAEKAKVIDPSATICPHCGAKLTGDKLQDVIDRFEKVKRERINEIVFAGRNNNVEIERLTKEIMDAQPYIDAAIPEVINQSTAELEEAVLKLANNQRTEAEFKETERGKTLLSDIESVIIPEVKMPDDKEIKEAKAKVNADLVPLYEKRGLKSRAETLKKNIEALRIEQKEKGAELAKYERQRQLVKDYKQEQMEILSHKVNDGLKFSRIDVWSKQKDGTVVPDLVLKDAQGVSYSTTNNASRIVTAIDVQRFFCEKLGVNMPCFIDEATIINADNLPVMEDVQTFYLFCSETALKIESK